MPDLIEAEVPIADVLREAHQQLMDGLEKELRRQGLAAEFNTSDIRKAQMAYVRHDFASAAQSFDRFFSRVTLREKSVSCMAVLWYSVSLARRGDKRAKEVLETGQQRLRAEFTLDHPQAALAWWCAAEAHSLLGEGNEALWCLREAYAEGPQNVRFWWFHAEDSEAFRSMRNEPDFAAFESEISSPSAQPV